MQPARDEEHPENREQDRCAQVNGLQRQAVCECLAEEDHRAVGEQHAASSAGDDGRQVRIGGRQCDRRDLRLVADLRNEEGDEGSEQHPRIARRRALLIELVRLERPQGHQQHADADDDIEHPRTQQPPEVGADDACHRVIGQRCEQDSQQNRPWPAVSGRQHER